jgi:hypothetical protein
MAPWVGTISAMQALQPTVVCPGHGARGDKVLLAHQRSFFVALRREVEVRVEAGKTHEQILGDLEIIRGALLSDDEIAGFVIPREADLAVLSLRAQVERTYEQMHN